MFREHEKRLLRARLFFPPSSNNESGLGKAERQCPRGTLIHSSPSSEGGRCSPCFLYSVELEGAARAEVRAEQGRTKGTRGSADPAAPAAPWPDPAQQMPEPRSVRGCSAAVPGAQRALAGAGTARGEPGPQPSLCCHQVAPPALPWHRQPRKSPRPCTGNDLHTVLRTPWVITPEWTFPGILVVTL